MVDALHKKRAVEKKAEREMDMFQKMLPALRAIMKNGGSADALLKKSGPMAAYRLVELLSSDKEEVVLKASEKIISYDLGKPVERSINVYGDLSRMNEKDVDNQIMMLLNKTGTNKLLETTLKIKRPKLQKRKPRKDDALILEATATVRTPEGDVPSGEAGTPPATED